jgi:photosystem II stability/assembly factor-like uncharacterized protein
MPPGDKRPGTTNHVAPGLSTSHHLLVATGNHVFLVDPGRGVMGRAAGVEARLPTCLATEPGGGGRAWCGTDGHGVLRSDDAGASWHPAGLPNRRVMALAASPSRPNRVWAGTEPSEVWRSDDAGHSWQRTAELTRLPSSSTWAFPPRPETHHVRWIAGHPADPDTVWVAVEAGALITTHDAGQSWHDRVPGGPFDTHELAVHPTDPLTLRVAAGDGYYESQDGGRSWESPMDGLDVGYFRSVAISSDGADVTLISGASGPKRTYVAGPGARPDGRVYRREGNGPWQRVEHGWPDPPATTAPLLATGEGVLWAADERGVHQSDDAGRRWRLVAPFPSPPRNLRGLVVR